MTPKKPSSTKKSALGDNPFDQFVPKEPEPKTQEKPAPKAKRERFSIRADQDLVEKVRDMVWKLSGPPECLTLSGFVEAALRRELTRLEKKYGPAEPRKGDLHRGRRV